MTPGATDPVDVDIDIGVVSTGEEFGKLNLKAIDERVHGQLTTDILLSPIVGFPMEGILGDLDSELQGMDFGEAGIHMGVGQGAEDCTPKAVGYLISTSPTGELPDEFWGHGRPQTVCSMFKVLLHCHRSVKAYVDPQQTLG